jgi:hypothetical protein
MDCEKTTELELMAYDKKKLYEQAVEIIKDESKGVIFIEEVVAYLPCTKSTFYDHFPIDSDESNALKELIESNKVKAKSKIRKVLSKSEKAAELLALYRLIATTEEHQKLNQSYIDHTSKGKEMKNNELTVTVKKMGE